MCKDVDWIQLVQDGVQLQVAVNTIFLFHKGGEFLD
jgi:hypothetical protein